MIEQTFLPFKLERSNELLTPHAGLILAHEFHVALGVDRLLDENVPAPGSGRGYRPSDVVLPAVLMLLGGGRDLDDIKVIAQDRALRQAAQLNKVPAASTLGDWLRRAGASRRAMGGLSKVNREVCRTTLRQANATEVTLDVDTTIIEAHKRDATRAYDGTVGYQPMMGFVFETRSLLHEEFRPGSASPGSGAVKFIQQCQRRMPKGSRIGRLRSDSAFYNHKVTDYCASQGIEYVIGADWDKAVREAYKAIPDEGWTEFVASGSKKRREAAETVHTFNKGHTSFRLVFVRDVEQQKTLFEDQPRGRALISSFAVEKMTAAEVVEWYNQRGTAENFIKELKHGVGMLHMPCGQLEANAAWFRIGALAYNLFLLSQSLAWPVQLCDVTLGTVRWRLYQTAARLTHHARQAILKVATDAATLAVMVNWRRISYQLAFP